MKKKHFWIIGIVLVLFFILKPVFHVLKTKWNESEYQQFLPKNYTNDASQLNLTKIDSIINVPVHNEKITEQLQSILIHAQENNLKISIGGAQHSMGGHTIYPNGILINMLSYNNMELDSTTNILTIGSGALWEDAIKYLDKKGKSIAVMQAFSSFSVGGSMSVNGHGWQKDLPPISSSVVSFTIMNYNGEILTCNLHENKELFKLVLGGYGLFGIILDVKLRVVDNTSLKFKNINLDPNDYLETYKKLVTENDEIELIFGRLRISEKRFLEDATLGYFEKTEEKPTPLDTDVNYETKRIIFRSTVNSEYGKRLRWNLETGMNKISKGNLYSRNDILNDHVDLIQNKDSNSTDILHEYFIPERNFNQFIDSIKPILLDSEIDLLNVTIRSVAKDTVSFLNYAREDVFGFVFLFNQQKTDSQEKVMRTLTNELVDITLNCEGTFYLPYRLHISKEKMRVCYPQADSFFSSKLKHDPKEVFNNKFYLHYK